MTQTTDSQVLDYIESSLEQIDSLVEENETLHLADFMRNQGPP